jgi:hypothetical protein
MEDIIRTYPRRKSISSYPFRYTTKDFDKYNEILNNKILQDKYNKWANGINYKTNRKININGKIHKDLKSIFMIECKPNYLVKERIVLFTERIVLFTELNNIDFEKYLLETETIYKDIDNKNKEIKIYNDIVYKIIENINNLDNWNNFIYFETKKYGIPVVFNNIHRENNCCGVIIEDYYEDCSCSSCENWGGCGKQRIYYYKCDNCCYKTCHR